MQKIVLPCACFLRFSRHFRQFVQNVTRVRRQSGLAPTNLTKHFYKHLIAMIRGREPSIPPNSWISKHLVSFFVLGTLVTAVLFCVYHDSIDIGSLTEPIGYYDDEIQKTNEVNSLVESGWIINSSRLGVPFGYSRMAFLRNDTLNYLLQVGVRCCLHLIITIFGEV
jgi:hypothetical protein